MSKFKNMAWCMVAVGVLSVVASAQDMSPERLAEFNRLEQRQQQVAVEYLQELTERALAERMKTLRWVSERKISKAKALSAAEIEAVSAAMARQLRLRAEFYRIMDHYSVASEPSKGSLVDGDGRLKGGLIALAAAVVLYDNHALCYAALRSDKQLHHLADRPDPGYGIKAETFSEILESYHSRENRQRFREALERLETYRVELERIRAKDKQVDYLMSLIESSPSVQKVGKGGFLGDYAGKLGLFAERVDVKSAFLGEAVVDGVSGAFGNSVGLIQTRHGKLYGRAEVAAALQSQLKPLDILLEKTPFRLTDKFIPGHFGHVAIWVGSEADLQAAGLWDDPLVLPYREQIRAGACVMEALRDGVQLNTLEHFLEVDDVAILRRNVLVEAPAATLRRAFRQQGKAYDFNFDVSTLDKIVCSELAYQVFTDVAWPTERALGRATISPDNVAVKALPGGEFHLVDFWHEGAQLSALEAQRRYQSLVAPVP